MDMSNPAWVMNNKNNNSGLYLVNHYLEYICLDIHNIFLYCVKCGINNKQQTTNNNISEFIRYLNLSSV